MRTGLNRDEWFHVICIGVAKASQCLSRKIGAILVRDNSVISQGYNGPPRGVRTCDERWFVDDAMCRKAGFSGDGFDTVYDDKKLKGVCPRYVPEMGFKSGE